MSVMARILHEAIQRSWQQPIMDQSSGTHAARTEARQDEPAYWLTRAETTPAAQSMARAQLNRWPSRAARCPACRLPWDGEGVCDACVDAMLAARAQALALTETTYPPLLLPVAPAPSGPLTYAQRMAARREAVSHA